LEAILYGRTAASQLLLLDISKRNGVTIAESDPNTNVYVWDANTIIKRTKDEISVHYVVNNSTIWKNNYPYCGEKIEVDTQWLAPMTTTMFLTGMKLSGSINKQGFTNILVWDIKNGLMNQINISNIATSQVQTIDHERIIILSQQGSVYVYDIITGERKYSYHPPRSLYRSQNHNFLVMENYILCKYGITLIIYDHKLNVKHTLSDIIHGSTYSCFDQPYFEKLNENTLIYIVFLSLTWILVFFKRHTSYMIDGNVHLHFTHIVQ
jgi:hypothetical protein